MNGIFEMMNISDAAFNTDLNRYLTQQDKSHAATESRIEELKDEYLDDEAQIFEVLISEEFVNFEAVQSTLRALVCAHKYGRTESLVTFAKSLAQQILDGVDKKAEWAATK